MNLPCNFEGMFTFKVPSGARGEEDAYAKVRHLLDALGFDGTYRTYQRMDITRIAEAEPMTLCTLEAGRPMYDIITFQVRAVNL